MPNPVVRFAVVGKDAAGLTKFYGEAFDRQLKDLRAHPDPATTRREPQQRRSRLSPATGASTPIRRLTRSTPRSRIRTLANTVPRNRAPVCAEPRLACTHRGRRPPFPHCRPPSSLAQTAPLRAEHVTAEIAENDGDENSPRTLPAGRIALSWLQTRRIGTARLIGEFCDIGHSASIVHLRAALAERLVHYGLDDLDAGDI